MQLCTLSYLQCLLASPKGTYLLPKKQGAAGLLGRIFLVSFIVELRHTGSFIYADVFPEGLHGLHARTWIIIMENKTDMATAFMELL